MGSTSNKKELGDRGEELAVQLLRKKGYKILERNWIFDHKEIDIIALDKNELVFVEVKSRVPEIMESYHDMISKGKIKNIVHAAEEYIMTHDYEEEVRFDVVFVLFTGGNTTLDHVEDAFISPLL